MPLAQAFLIDRHDVLVGNEEVIFGVGRGAGPVKKVGMGAKSIYVEGGKEVGVRGAKELAKGIKSSRIEHARILTNGFQLYTLSEPVYCPFKRGKYDGFCRKVVPILNG